MGCPRYRQVQAGQSPEDYGARVGASSYADYGNMSVQIIDPNSPPAPGSITIPQAFSPAGYPYAQTGQYGYDPYYYASNYYSSYPSCPTCPPCASNQIVARGPAIVPQVRPYVAAPRVSVRGFASGQVPCKSGGTCGKSCCGDNH